MLKRLGEEKTAGTGNPAVKITESAFPAPFVSGLEYGAPARGTWNIVHVGMLIPEAHQIFVCAQGCLRGVVLTAAEMGASHRFSTITVREQNILDGDMEDLIIEGVSDILERLPKVPPAILIYTSCVHHFMGSDLDYVYRVLRERYPKVHFTDCYMNPIMRKSGLTPDQTMRRQLYSLLPLDGKFPDNKKIHLAGCDFPLNENSELYECLTKNGYSVCEAASCKTYAEYQKLADCSLCITTFPAAKTAGNYLENKYGQKHLYLPSSFSYSVIRKNLNVLSDVLGIEIEDSMLQERERACEAALFKAKDLIGDTEVVIDFTAYPFMLSLAKLLVQHGFRVTKLYTDSMPAEEKEEFEWLQKHAPDIQIYPTVHASMRVVSRKHENKILAIGQKAAYFNGTAHFVNLVEGGGHWGYESVLDLAEQMMDAYAKEKDTKSLIQIKGMGCGCCG